MRDLVSFRRRLTAAQRFERLLEPHFDAMYAAARRMTLSPHDAEDLVQETCIKAFDCLEEFEGMEYPRAWLLKVMYHRFVDEKRRAVRSPVDRSQTGSASVDPDEQLSGGDGPDDLVDRMQTVERILRAMQVLSGDQCALVAMHDIEGVSIEDLSSLTGMPEGTIKAQLHRTRKKLGRLLSNDAVSRPRLKLIGGKQ